METDAHVRRSECRELARRVPVDRALAMGRQVREQRIADERVSEPVSRVGPFDDSTGKSGVEPREHGRLGKTGERDELVGVELHPGDRDALERVAGGAVDSADGGGALLLAITLRELDDREWVATRDGRDASDRLLGRARTKARHEGPRRVEIQRTDVDLGRARRAAGGSRAFRRVVVHRRSNAGRSAISTRASAAVRAR